MPEQVVIVGDGQMGLVLAALLASNGVAVRLWGRDESRVAELAATRRSPRRLGSFELAQAVEVTSCDEAVFEGATIIINSVPTQFIRPIWQRLKRYVPTRTPIVSVSKGIENDTLLRPTQAIADALDGNATGDRPMCGLSGPTIAAEMAQNLPATMVAASDDDSLAQHVQNLLGAPSLRIYRHDDLVGVEIAGATKNVIALAAGMVDGLGAGINAKSALLARGLAEIVRLGTAMGARADTFFGVAGVGDLATTCFSPLGRNRSCGERLGRGDSLDSILGGTASVVEGVATTRSVMQLARRYDVNMPITEAVGAILFNGLSPREAIASLMQREPKVETIG